jgi:crotonobetainyl-CoA:carnitine CoA-transferase CaiB-like acyl-CoA transferase
MLLAFGMAAALVAVKTGGPGQVVDAAMTEGSSLLAGMLRWLSATGRWRDQRGVNLLDGGAHFYDSYETADGKYVAIGAIEPQFYALLLEKLGLTGDAAFRAQLNPAAWPALSDRLAAIFRTKTRDEWCALLEGTDICFAPVLSLGEAPQHPHNVARNAFVDVGRRAVRAASWLEEQDPSEQEDPLHPELHLLVSERESLVRSTLALLPDEQLRVIRLSFFDGFAHAEIADLLGIPLGTVKSRIRLAMQRLRDRLGELK